MFDPNPNARMRRVLVLSLVAAMLLPTATMVPAGSASSHDDTLSSCLTVAENPIFIREVQFSNASGSFEDGAVFVDPGDTVHYTLVIENRLAVECNVELESTERIQARQYYPLGNHITGNNDTLADGVCRDVDPGGEAEYCREIHGTFEIPESLPQERLDQGDSLFGEHRVRFVAADTNSGEFNPLAGAERVLVVGVRPDLVVNRVDTETSDPKTTYGSGDDLSFLANISNVGTYPAWNPNGGDFWFNRSSFDAPGDGNEAPDHRERGLPNDDFESTSEVPIPTCAPDNPNSAQRMEPGDTDGDGDADRDVVWDHDITCSYRYGVPLDQNLRYDFRKIRPEEAPNGSLSAVLDDGNVSTTYSSYIGDKDFDRAVPLHEKNEQVCDAFDQKTGIGSGCDPSQLRWHTFELGFQGLSTQSRAGTFQVNVTVDKDADNRSRVLELNETLHPQGIDGEANNNLTAETTISGADLVFDTADREDKNGAPSVFNEEDISCGGSNNPCEPGTLLEVDIGFKNAGDETIPSSQEWKVAIFLNGEVATQASGDPAIFTPNDPTLGPGESQQLRSQPVLIRSLEGGGEHRIAVALDPPEVYESRFDERVGRVAEYTDVNECQPTHDGQFAHVATHNVYCTVRLFTDEQAPMISNLGIVRAADDSEATEVVEGTELVFNATVDDPSLQNVTAIFETPEGEEIANLTMVPEEEGSDNHILTRTVVGLQANETIPADQKDDHLFLPSDLGRFVFKVYADDGINPSTVTPDTDAVEFEVSELEKRVEVKNGPTLNGETTFTPEDAPEYRGTAVDPANVFNITFEVNDDGRPDDSSAGKVVEVYDDDGELVYSLDAASITTCQTQDAGEGVTQDKGSVGRERDYGSLCSENEAGLNSENREVVDGTVDTWHYVSSAEVERWPDVNLTWVGDFKLSVNVTDAYLRSEINHSQVRLNDRDGDPVVEDAAFAPHQADPDRRVRASAFVTDALRVEAVRLNATHQATEESFLLDLAFSGCERDIDPCNDDNAGVTRNGTWESSWRTGANGAFDRAGTWTIDLEAVDFADNVTTVDLGELVVNDTDTPDIRQFFTEPQGGVQEVGGNVTWKARIVDSTAIKAPELVLSLPTSPQETLTMELNETSGLWVANRSVTGANIGTWSYTLNVEDHAGHIAEATGSIEIKESRPPQASTWQPNVVADDGTVYGPPSPTIEFDLVDFSHGVDLDTVNLTVNGEDVAYQADPIPNGFHITHTPAEAFADGETVTVQVEATDKGGLANDAPQTHSFVVDGTAPEVSFEADPAQEESDRLVIGATSDLTVGVEDAGSGPGPLDVTVQHLAGTTATAEETITFEAGNGTFRLTDLEDAFQGHGNYRILATPTDAVGNEGSNVQTRVLFDKSPPKVQVFAKPGQPREAIFADISDESTVEDAWVLYTPEGGDEERLELDLINGTWQNRIPAFPKNTTINFTVKAEDLFGNIGSSPPDSFEAGDAVPTITLTKPTQGQTLEGTQEITWTASDLETTASQLKVSLYYRQPGQDFKAIPEAQNLGNVGRYNLDTTLLPNGDLTLQAIVFDGNNFGDSKVDVTVRNLAAIFNNPTMDGATRQDGQNVVEPGQEVVFRVEIDATVTSAFANVTDAQGNSVANIELTEAGAGTWTASFEAPTQPGDYSVDLLANTADGPVETDGAYGFTVQGASEEDSKSFVSEWTVLSVLFAGAVAVGAIGLTRRWT